LPPEDERVGREEQRSEGQPRQCVRPLRRPPGEEGDGGQEGDADRSREQGEARDEPGGQEAPPLGEDERGDAQQEEERLAVDGLEEQRHREEREIEDGATRALGAELRLREVVEEDERGERRGERDDDPCEQVVAEEGASEEAHGAGVERVEGGRRALELAVAVFGDPQEPDAVPTCPDVGHPAEVSRDGRVVPAGRLGVAVRLEDEPGEEGRGPDRRTAPEEDLDRGAERLADVEVAARCPRPEEPLTRAHDGRIIPAWPIATSPPRRRTRPSARCARWPRRWSSGGGC
jgi:hypothetical protein